MPPVLFFFFHAFSARPPEFSSEHNVVRSDLTPWQFSIFSKSCEDAEQRWTYAAVSVQDHQTVGFLFTETFNFKCYISTFGDAKTGIIDRVKCLALCMSSQDSATPSISIFLDDCKLKTSLTFLSLLTYLCSLGNICH